MALAFYPHTLMVAPATEAVDGATLAVSVPTFGTAVPIRGQLKAMTAEAAYKAHGVDIQQPHLFLFDPGQEGAFNPGYRATLGARVFSVKTQARQFNAGDTCDYSTVLMEEESLAE
jgi:hypothetical protein